MDALILLVQITLKESVPCSHTLATTFTAEPQYSSVQKTCLVTAWPKATITRGHFLKTSYNVNNRNSSSLHCSLRGRGGNELLQHVTVGSIWFPWCLLLYFMSTHGSSRFMSSVHEPSRYAGMHVQFDTMVIQMNGAQASLLLLWYSYFPTYFLLCQTPS